MSIYERHVPHYTRTFGIYMYMYICKYVCWLNFFGGYDADVDT